MNVFVFLIVTLIVSLILYTVLKMYRKNEYVKDVPVIKWAILKQLVTTNKTPVDTFNIIEQMFRFRRGLSKFWIGTKLAVVCNDPADIKLILMSKNCVDKPYLYRFIGGGDGLFSSHGDCWKRDRKKFNTVFTLSILKTFEPIFNRHFAQLIKNLEENLDQPEFDITNYLFSCNFDIVCETIFNFDSGTQTGENVDAVNNIARLWEVAKVRITVLLLHPDIFFRFTNLYAEQAKCLDYLSNIGHRILKNAHNIRVTNLSNQSEKRAACDDTAASSKSMILIDKLLEMERQGLIDLPRIIDQLNTFIVAGTDTSSITMLSTLLMLAINQDIQERVYEEICANVRDIDHLDYDALTKMDYMERTIKETMRLFPLVQGVLRETDDNVQLTECILPKGTLLFLGIFKMHRSEEIWGPTANEFDPDRFLPESMVGRHPFAYLPFSAGPRNCIGAKYAMVSMKMMLCHTLMAFKLSTSLKMSDIILKFEVLLKMDNKCLVKLDRRQ